MHEIRSSAPVEVAPPAIIVVNSVNNFRRARRNALCAKNLDLEAIAALQQFHPALCDVNANEEENYNENREVNIPH